LLVKFRNLLADEGAEVLLARNIELAVSLRLIFKNEPSQIIVASSLEEKAIVHPKESMAYDPLARRIGQ